MLLNDNWVLYPFQVAGIHKEMSTKVGVLNEFLFEQDEASVGRIE